MKLSINIFNGIDSRQNGLRTLRKTIKKRFPQAIPEEVLIELMDAPTNHQIYIVSDLVAYVRFREKILFEIHQNQPLVLHIEEHSELLQLPQFLQDTLRERFSLLLGG